MPVPRHWALRYVLDLGWACVLTIFFFSVLAAADDDAVWNREAMLQNARDKNSTAENYTATLKKLNERALKADAQFGFDWIYTLNDWYEIGKSRFEFREPTPELYQLSRTLTRLVAPHLNFREVDPDFLQLFYQWASNDLRFRVAQIQSYLIKPDSQIKEPAEKKARLFTWHVRLAQLSRQLNKLTTSGSPIGHHFELDVQTFEETQQVLAYADAKVVGNLAEQLTTFNESEIDRILQDCLSEAAIMTILDRLEGFSLSIEDGPWLGKIVEWTLILFRKVEALGNDTQFALRAQPGRILITAIKKLLESGQTLDSAITARIAGSPTTEREFQEATLEKLVDHIIRVLESPNLLEELAVRLANVYRQRLVSNLQMDLVYLLGTKLCPRVRGDSFEMFNEFLQRVLIHKLRRELGWEGTYSILMGGSPTEMTLGFTGGQTLVAGFTKYVSNTVPVSIVFDRVFYNRQKESFEAAYPDGEEGLTFRLERRWDDKIKDYRNHIVGRFEPSNSAQDQLFEGYQIHRLPKINLVDVKIPWTPIADATFIGGYVDGQSGKEGPRRTGENFRLRIRENESGLRAKVFKSIPVGIAPISLPTTFIDRNKRLLYLTSLQLGNGKTGHGEMLQIRGILSADGNTLEGYEMRSGHYFRRILLRKYVDPVTQGAPW